ncbi:MAG: RHS repeat-associated core domain-containing protein [Nitrospira sp.]
MINYVYDGLNSVQEKNGGMVTANLLTGLGIDEFFTRTDGVGARALLPDALGSTLALGDNTGTLQTEYTYEPFGFTTQTGSASTSSYKYTGREDDGTGLMYYRARYYQPRFQRFISEDPIGFHGGSFSIYAYVSNNPLNLVDPSGLSPVGWIVQLGDKCMKKVKALFSDREMRQARSEGKDVLVNGTRQKANQIESGGSGGKPNIKHSGHDLGGGVRGLPHMQTPGRPGHTFWLRCCSRVGESD